MIMPLYDQGTLILVSVPDDTDLTALWLAAMAGNIKITGETQ